MSDKSIKVLATFVPDGESEATASETRTVEFFIGNVDSDTIIAQAKQEVKDQDILQSYALRKYWTLAKIKCISAGPYDSVDEFLDAVDDYDDAPSISTHTQHGVRWDMVSPASAL